MSVKDAEAKKRRENRKAKKEAKKDPFAPERVSASFDNAFMNLSGEVLLRHFTNKNNHEIYVLFEKRLNINEADLRKLFVSEQAENQKEKDMVTCIKVSFKEKVVEQKLMKEKDLQRIVVEKYLKEKNRRF